MLGPCGLLLATLTANAHAHLWLAIVGVEVHPDADEAFLTIPVDVACEVRVLVALLALHVER